MFQDKNYFFFYTLFCAVLWTGIVLMPIRIRISILMPLHMRIRPQILHLLENHNFFTYGTFTAVSVNIVVSFLSVRIHNTGSVSVFFLLFCCTLRLRWDWTRRMLLRQLSTYAANILSARFSSFVSGTLPCSSILCPLYLVKPPQFFLCTVIPGIWYVRPYVYL